MLPHQVQTLLDDLESLGSIRSGYETAKAAARALMRDEAAAVALVTELGTGRGERHQQERMMQLLTSALDEARMAAENGQQLGQSFLVALEQHLDVLNGQNSLTQNGRLSLASSWIRAGLSAPEALQGGLEGADYDEEFIHLDPKIDFRALVDRFLETMQTGYGEDLAGLIEGMRQLLATLPSPVQQELLTQIVAHDGENTGKLGVALVLDRTSVVWQGALAGLEERLEAGTLTPDLLARLTVIRSWTDAPDLLAGIDGLVRRALRKGVSAAAPAKPPKLHRIVASLLDGTGAQNFAVAIQNGGVRSVAVLLVKQGFGVKDAYLVPCPSATEQRRLMEMVASGVETRELPSSYLREAIALGITDGKKTGHLPPPSLVDVLSALGMSDLRPLPASVADIVGMIDHEETLVTMSAQARGRLINESRAWASVYPLIAESWFEDSDSFVSAMDGAINRTSLKRALWKAFETRRAYWALVIARMGHLLRASGDTRALEFAAVALALSEGRALSKVPILQTVFDATFSVWADRSLADARGVDADVTDERVFASGGGNATAQFAAPQPEEDGELDRLLRPAQLTEWWVDGYMMGVCTAIRFIPPGDWVQVLLQFVMDDIGDHGKLQRLLDLFVMRYNAAAGRLCTPIGVSLVPGDAGLIGIWSDGFLTAWEGNSEGWPKARLTKADKETRKLLEAATSGRVDMEAFRKTVPSWLRHRYAVQENTG